jgi:hypothetical protein
MQQVLPIQPLPSQTFEVILGTQSCQITLQWMATGLFITLTVNGNSVLSSYYCNNRVSLVRRAYLGFVGWLYFVDTQGDCDPNYAQLGSRYLLVYESN